MVRYDYDIFQLFYVMTMIYFNYLCYDHAIFQLLYILYFTYTINHL